MSGKKWLGAILAGGLLAGAAMSERRLATALAPPPPPVSAPAIERPSSTPKLEASDVGAWLDGYFPVILQQGKIAGAQVVVVKDGQVLFKKGYGYADVAAKRQMDPDSILMRIGSTSKLFTWTAVMQLVEAGKIDLNADVNRYIDFKLPQTGGRPITMNDLMNHRGGFEEGLKDLLVTDPARLKTTERFLKEDGRPLLFPAGEVPAYSNYGVALAGYIVQRVSGEPFADYIERHVLAPLQMQHTTFVQPLPSRLAPFVSKGYPQSDLPPSPFELVSTAPAGSVSTTGADMAKFMIAHLQEGRFGTAQILRPETVRLMHTPVLRTASGFDAMAHGFFYARRNGRLVLAHGGDTIVFHTDLNLLPAEGVGIFVSFNSRGANGAVYPARERLFDLFMDRYFPAPAATTPPAIADAVQHAKALAGYYESSRRIETGFLSLFYLIQQDSVVANDDGTIAIGSIEDKRFREIAPGLWREVDGPRQLQITEIGGRRAILDSTNPVSILQAVPLRRNALLFQMVAGLSLLVLLGVVLVWPVRALLRRRYRLAPSASGRVRRVQRFTRLAALADLLYLAGWCTMLAPVLQDRLSVYNDGLNGTIRLLQVAAIVPIVGALVGLWNARLAFLPGSGWEARTRATIVALALLGFLWIAWIGGLISWTLSY